MLLNGIEEDMKDSLLADELSFLKRRTTRERGIVEGKYTGSTNNMRYTQMLKPALLRKESSEALSNMRIGPRGESLPIKEYEANLLFAGPPMTTEDFQLIRELSFIQPDCLRGELVALDYQKRSGKIHSIAAALSSYDVEKRCSHGGMRSSTLMTELRRKQMMSAYFADLDAPLDSTEKVVNDKTEYLPDNNHGNIRRKLSHYLATYYPDYYLENSDSCDENNLDVKCQLQRKSTKYTTSQSFSSSTLSCSPIRSSSILPRKRFNHIPYTKKTGGFIPQADHYDIMRSRWEKIGPSLRLLEK